MTQVFLLSLQTMNLVDKNIPLIGITSIGIGITWTINVKGASGDKKSIIAYLVGGSIGAMSSVPFHTMLLHWRGQI